jgi:IMP dehydrogenase
MSKTFLGALDREYEWPDLHPSVDPMQITYDDVLLAPNSETKVLSRKNVDISVQFGPYKLDIPIMTAPMDTITGEKMVREMHDLGGIGTLPRATNGHFRETLEIAEKLAKEGIPFVPSIGLKESVEEARLYKESGGRIVLIDTAHGGQERIADIANEIRDKLGLDVIAGNIATYKQAKFYKDRGLEFARVGVGPGGLCTTRLVAGTGVPQLAALFEVTSANIDTVIADGGIKHPGDVAKAIAAKATVVMIGSMFGGTDETPGEIDESGYKIVRGQASHDYMVDNKVSIDRHRAPEGISTKVKAKGPVRKIVDKMTGGLKSAMAYTGAHTIAEFQKKARFVVISGSAQKENQPHIQGN